MKPETIIKLMRLLYANILRDIIVQFVQSTDNDYDDMLVDILDRVFGM